MLVVNQFGAAIRSRKGGTSPFAVLPASRRQRISHPDVENRMITVCDDINPETVIACHSRNRNPAMAGHCGRNDKMANLGFVIAAPSHIDRTPALKPAEAGASVGTPPMDALLTSKCVKFIGSELEWVETSLTMP